MLIIADLITLFVFLLSCDSQCSVALPYGAVGWYVLCAGWSELLLVGFRNVELLNFGQHRLEFLSLKGGSTCSLSLHLSKCRIVENHMRRLNNGPCL